MEYGQAPRRIRYLFWLVLGALSTVIPEVIAGSDLYPFFKITDYLIVIPLYTLHSLVLWYIIWNWGKPRLYNLFPAGAIFGLYEAYMTKVIWDPTWSALPLKVFGIALVETLILVLFWHSFLAFIVPLFVAESLTSSREIIQGLPVWFSDWLVKLKVGRKYLLLPFIAGFFQSINTPTLQDSIMSGLTSTVITITLVSVWKKTSGSEFTLRSLLPNQREFKFLLSLLLIMYGFMGVFWRPEALPGIVQQVTVWVLYLFFGTLLYIGIKKSREDISLNPVEIILSDRNMLFFGVVFTLGSIFGKASRLSIIAVIFVWFGGIIFGLYVLVKTTWSLR
ncbi:hypothetical protein ACFL0D_02230 [Thermoproteota archaeon]